MIDIKKITKVIIACAECGKQGVYYADGGKEALAIAREYGWGECGLAEAMCPKCRIQALEKAL